MKSCVLDSIEATWNHKQQKLFFFYAAILKRLAVSSFYLGELEYCVHLPTGALSVRILNVFTSSWVFYELIIASKFVFCKHAYHAQQHILCFLKMYSILAHCNNLPEFATFQRSQLHTSLSGFTTTSTFFIQPLCVKLNMVAATAALRNKCCPAASGFKAERLNNNRF